MAATAGSIYQALATQHNAGNPPNTQAQQSNETFALYQARMAANACLPDILATESDAAYITRIGALTNTPASSHKLWGFATINNSNLTSSTVGCSMTRATVGSYVVTFNSPTNNANYAVFFNGFSGSTSNPTASFGYASAQTTTNFSMSTFLETSALAASDFTSGSFVIFNS